MLGCVRQQLAVFRIASSEGERRKVNAERGTHSETDVCRQMLVVCLLHCGRTREKAAEIARASRPIVQRSVAAYRDGGLDGLRRGVRGLVSDHVAHTTAVRAALTARPVRPAAARAAEQIEHLTPVKRQPT